MTGELADVFPRAMRACAALLDTIEPMCPSEEKLHLCGALRLCRRHPGSRKWANDVASANWHATASLVGQAQRRWAVRRHGVDHHGSSSRCVGGAVDARGYSDAQRLLAGELVYTGFTRTFLMSVTTQQGAGCWPLYAADERIFRRHGGRPSHPWCSGRGRRPACDRRWQGEDRCSLNQGGWPGWSGAMLTNWRGTRNGLNVAAWFSE